MRLHHSHHHPHLQITFTINSIFEMPSQNIQNKNISAIAILALTKKTYAERHQSSQIYPTRKKVGKSLIPSRTPVFRRSLNIVKGTTDPGVDCFNL